MSGEVRVQYDKKATGLSESQKRFKQSLPIPRDTEKGFPLLEIQHFDHDFNSLILSQETIAQLERIIREFKDADIIATYNLSYKKKIYCILGSRILPADWDNHNNPWPDNQTI